MTADHPRSKGRTGRPWRRAREHVRRNTDVCAICGQPIDHTLTWPDPQSFSVDHIIPLSHLDPRDPRLRSHDNLRGVHLSCNARRGTGQTADLGTTSEDW